MGHGGGLTLRNALHIYIYIYIVFIPAVVYHATYIAECVHNELSSLG